MKALISLLESKFYMIAIDWEMESDGDWTPIYETIENAYRVLEVRPDDEIFEVNDNLKWVDCSEDCSAKYLYYKDGVVYKKPEEMFHPDSIPDEDEPEEI